MSSHAIYDGRRVQVLSRDAREATVETASGQVMFVDVQQLQPIAENATTRRAERVFASARRPA